MESGSTAIVTVSPKTTTTPATTKQQYNSKTKASRSNSSAAAIKNKQNNNNKINQQQTYRATEEETVPNVVATKNNQNNQKQTKTESEIVSSKRGGAKQSTNSNQNKNNNNNSNDQSKSKNDAESQKLSSERQAEIQTEVVESSNSNINSTTSDSSIKNISYSKNHNSNNNNITDMTLQNNEATAMSHANLNATTTIVDIALANNNNNSNSNVVNNTNSNNNNNNNNNDNDVYNHGKYLHKKFKRVVSTINNNHIADVVVATNDARSTNGREPQTITTTTTTTPAETVTALTNGHTTSVLIKQQQKQQQKTEEVQNFCAAAISNESANNLVVNHKQNDVDRVSSDAATAVALSVRIPTPNAVAVAGRHVCPYCSMNCTKPSVLQKHIRAHTNERPYPCSTCAIAFKTKSNYYKHCRSRTHAARVAGTDVPTDADDSLFGPSDQEGDTELSSNSSDVTFQTSRMNSPLDDGSNSSFVLNREHQQQQRFVAASPTNLSINKSSYQTPSTSVPPINVNGQVGGATQTSESKPYKPKFHRAARYVPINDTNDGHTMQHQHQEPLPHRPQQDHALPTVESQQKSVPALQLVSQLQPKMMERIPNELPKHQQYQPAAHHQHTPALAPASPLIKVGKHITNAHPVQLKQSQPAQTQHPILQTQLPLALPPQQQLSIIPNGPSVLPALQSQALAAAAAAASSMYYLSQPTAPAAAAAALSLMHPAQAAAVAQQQMYAAAIAAHNYSAFQLMSPQQQQHLHLQHLQHQYQLVQQQQTQQTTLLKTASPATVALSVQVPAQQPHSMTRPKITIIPTTQVQAQAQPRVSPIAHNNGNAIGNNTIPASNLCAFTAATGSKQVNVEKVQEHISKLISQNEAIVENKELLLQKKYPKQLNRSRSFNSAAITTNSNSNSSTNSNSSLNLNIVSLSSSNSNNNAITITTAMPSERDTNIKLVQTIAQKQQYQMQQHMHQQQSQHLAIIPSPATPPNGISKHPYIGVKPLQQPHKLVSTIAVQHSTSPTPQTIAIPASLLGHKELTITANVPLNLSSKPGTSSTIKRQHLESVASSPVSVTVTVNAQNIAGSSTNSNSISAASVANSIKNAQNNSIIKNLLLTSRGLAVPIGEGDDAVYACPLCAMEFRAPEDLQLHNGSCQGAAMSPESSSSVANVYLRPDSIGLSLPELRNSLAFSKNPLSLAQLAKLAWSQLRTKPSSLVLNRLSAAQTVARTTTMTQTSSSSSLTISTVGLATTSSVSYVDAPLPSPGPLLGKTPLVDYSQQHSSRAAASEVIITKMHDEGQFMQERATNKRTSELVDVSPKRVRHDNELSGCSKTSGALYTSGGVMIPISECNDVENSPKMIRTPLLSGGSFQEVLTAKVAISREQPLSLKEHFQFPPINSITAYNPLTLPPQRAILPHVPGMPGPNSLTDTPIAELASNEFNQLPSTRLQRSANNQLLKPAVAESPAPKKFNFSRMADNVSPQKTATDVHEIRHFNFDNVSKPLGSPMDMHVALHIETPSLASVETTTTATKNTTKFVRPTSLPLKPGTFTPKCHHGITPTTNTLPLISPETPRPSKSYMQLYHNGHAYTYLGLKCSTKVFYCTVNLPQPTYVDESPWLSMYSVWQVCAESHPHPLGFKPDQAIALLDSRQKRNAGSMANSQCQPCVVRAQGPVMTPFVVNDVQKQFYHHPLKRVPAPEPERPEAVPVISNDEESPPSTSLALLGGFESHEEYTYIRGRGRGRYVCKKCGIRCRKPSMLKKHIRSHTDLRPYTCKICKFSFKTKGNLTKHLQSKAHYKKCAECGIEASIDGNGDYLSQNVDFDQQSSTSASGRTESLPEDSDGEDSDSECESESTSKAVSFSSNEQEAASGLLTLAITQSASPSLHQQHIADISGCGNVVSVPAPSPANSIGSAASAYTMGTPKRVISYTSPKPPFDYHKQEKYYSNPEESKPKLNSCIDESAPMDLTTSRNVAENSIKGQVAPLVTNNHHDLKLSDTQIRNEIFGDMNNAFSVMKTMLSVSSTMHDYLCSGDDEHTQRQPNEHLLHPAYVKEQALQYFKMKQCQMTTSAEAGVTVSIAMNTEITAATTNIDKCVPTLLQQQQVSEGLLLQPVIEKDAIVKAENVTLTTNAIEELPVKQRTPVKLTPTSKLPPSSTPSTSPPVSVTEALSAPVSTVAAIISPVPLQAPVLAPHNANLPAAVQPSNATDFSGVFRTAPPQARTVLVGEDGIKTISGGPINYMWGPSIAGESRPYCTSCQKKFQTEAQYTLHMKTHEMVRPYRCEPCSTSFYTDGHLKKHEKSELHRNKTKMSTKFGVATSTNPRPYECSDCRTSFRIHGHLAKHLRSKMHIQKLECLEKLPHGTYAQVEHVLTEIDTTDANSAYQSLKQLADELLNRDPDNKRTDFTSSALPPPSSRSPRQEVPPTSIGSQDSASEDGFSAAASAAATAAIASLDNESKTTSSNTLHTQASSPKSENESVATTNDLKRQRAGCSEADNREHDGGEPVEKRVCNENATTVDNNELTAASGIAN